MTVPRLLGSLSAVRPTAASSSLLVLLPSLGTTAELWAGVSARLSAADAAPRILHVDLPGHGASPAAREPFTVAELAEAVLRLVADVGGGAFHLAGDSLGGAVALELAIAVPERVLSLSLFCSGAKIGTAETWAQRAAQVRASGTASVVAGSAVRWFAPGYLDAHPDGPGGHALTTLIDVDDESYALCCEALATFDRREDTGAVHAQALVVAGAHDTVTTPTLMRELADSLPEARFVELAHAGHLIPLEDPAETAALIGMQLAARPAAPGPTRPDSASAHASGMSVRRSVLGDEHVDRAVEATTPETADFQDFITRYAWGEVWARPELSRAQRSIATIASLVTGGHENEIRMHVRAALRNGLTRTEIAEVIHHTALYAGLPAANGAFALMRAVFAELDAEQNTAQQPGPDDTPHHSNQENHG